MIASHLVLKWFHIIAMVYWLGGEWGVFQTSYHVPNPKLPLDERRRHMETAYRIDILARLGIILLLPIGLHMGHNFGVQPLGGGWLVGMWILTAAWVALALSAFVRRGTDAGIRLTRFDDRIRYVLIPALAVTATMSLLTGHPFTAKWYAAKVLIYSGLLVIGLILRFVMRHWTETFRQLAAGGPNAELEAKLTREIRISRRLAYVYWIGIGTVAFIGTTKFF
jgi:small-conductance mechanosensitive channel